MDKDLIELLDKINGKKQEVKNLVEENKLDAAESSKKELIALQKQFDLIYDLENEKRNQIENSVKSGAGVKQINPKKDGIQAFADAARSDFRGKMTEGSSTDGGYTVPEDIRTQIEKYREAKSSLMDLVRVETVKAEKGSRTFKKRMQQTGFIKVGEGGKISGKNTPQFERISYEISKYAGYFPVTSELLEDSDANIVQTLIEWIGDESRVTRNKLILEQIQTKTKTSFTDLDSIKDAINIELGSAFKNTSYFITNDDGFAYFDKLKNKDGDYLLQPIVTDTTQYRLFGLPLKVYPNVDLPSTTTAGKKGIPLIIGDLQEGIVFFDRKQLNIKSSDIAAVEGLNAFEEDLILWRAIEREDVKIRDENAFIHGEILVDDTAVVEEL